MNGNWWKLFLALAVPALIFAATWGATKLQVSDIRDKEVPALKEADKELEAVDKEQQAAITNVEKDIIGVKGSIDRNTDAMDALKEQQKAYHDESDEKLNEILDRLPVR